MLYQAFENVAPYIENINTIRKFVQENEGASVDEVIEKIESHIKNDNGTIVTDFRILLNEIRKMINTEL